MSSKEVSLYLKVPSKPPTLLHRLENSLLESLVEYKPIDTSSIRNARLLEVPSIYQTKGRVEVIDRELLVQFRAKKVGIHTARIFANTKEICQPVVFIVKPSGDVESIEYTSPPLDYTDSGLVSGTSTVRGVESQPTISPFNVPPAVSPPPFAQSQVSRSLPPLSSPVYKPGSPPPLSFENLSNEGSYPGELFGRPAGATFHELLTAKEKKRVIPGIPHSSRPSSTGTNEELTTEIFQQISKEAKKSVGINFTGLKIKKRCDICSRKIKAKKCVTFWDTDFCDGCCKRNFMLRSAIEHFMAPSIKECTVQIPLNKRGTKIANSKKIMPDVNLRGLEPNDIRNAMMEFHKFDIEGDGWMSKVVLLPVMKACFTYSMHDKEIRMLLASKSLASMMETMGLKTRDKIHHVEFLALLAFIARERQRLNKDLLPSSKFTHSDLEMAYAFQRQFGAQQHKQPVRNHMVTTVPTHDHYKIPQQHGGTNMTKSFTVDSPLSQYQPTSLIGDQNVVTSLPSSPVKKAHFEIDEASEKEETDHLEMVNETPNTEQNAKSKGDMMEQMKFTGDGKADAWMMY